jgi:hypothetical protein
MSEQLRVDSAEERAAREAELFFERARAVLTPLRLNRGQLADAWEAFQNFPDGVTRIAREALSGRIPAALFLTKLHAGDHENGVHVPQKAPTGWRFQRGSHSGTYVEDPEGFDTPPPGYFTTPGGSSNGLVMREPERLETSVADYGNISKPAAIFGEQGPH